jgi:hypothetical protein
MMVEWILAGLICATTIAMIAHTIDEAISSARPLRAQSTNCANSAVLASQAQHRRDDGPQKRAA